MLQRLRKVAVICDPNSLTGRTAVPEDAVPLNPNTCQSASTGFPVKSSKLIVISHNRYRLLLLAISQGLG